MVDDSSTVRRIMLNALAGEPSVKVVATASDGVDAVEQVKANQVDVVITDLEMPRMDGIGEEFEGVGRHGGQKAGQPVEVMRGGGMGDPGAGGGLGKAYALELCLEEMVANILLHGQVAGRAVQARVTIKANPLRLIVEDDGPSFDPTLQPEAEMAADLDSAGIGGRGLALVRRFSVTMCYQREAGWNRVEFGLD